MLFIGDFMTYLLIFVLKVMENALSTLRLILVSNGKKLLGSILHFITSIVWVTSSSVAIININVLMILTFSVGSLIGSYVGSLIEEKIALGTNLIICITDKKICDFLRDKGYILTKLNGDGLNSKKDILFIIIERKKNKELIKFISSLDSKAVLISEHANVL